MPTIETIIDASGQTTYVNGAARLTLDGTGVTVAGTFTGGGSSGGGGSGGYATGVRQIVMAQTGTQASGTGTIPYDNTIPQITEGWEVLTCSITPQSATSTLYVCGIVNCSSSFAGAATVAMAIFRDATANSLGTSFVNCPFQYGNICIVGQVKVTSGSTSATTFRMRIGGNVGTTYANGQQAAGAVFAGNSATTLVVMEVGA